MSETIKPEFKIGDKVVCVDNTHYNNLLQVGAEYTICRIEPRWKEHLWLAETPAAGPWLKKRFVAKSVSPQKPEDVRAEQMQRSPPASTPPSPGIASIGRR